MLSLTLAFAEASSIADIFVMGRKSWPTNNKTIVWSYTGRSTQYKYGCIIPVQHKLIIVCFYNNIMDLMSISSKSPSRRMTLTNLTANSACIQQFIHNRAIYMMWLLTTDEIPFNLQETNLCLNHTLQLLNLITHAAFNLL